MTLRNRTPIAAARARTRPSGKIALAGGLPASMLADAAAASDTRGENLILQGLEAGDRQALLRVMRPASLTAGEVLFEPDDEIVQVYFPRSGAVSLMLFMEEGASVETRMVGREGVTCPVSFMRSSRSVVRAVVQFSGDAWRIKAAQLRALTAERPGLRAAMESYSDHVLRELAQAAGCNAAHRLEPRLARWLLSALDRVGGSELPLTQEDLGRRLSAQRTTVTMVAKRLQARGVIEYRRGRLRVLDRRVLEALSCECYAAGAPPP
jgi:CRP-like cAMP-binding protein